MGTISFQTYTQKNTAKWSLIKAVRATWKFFVNQGYLDQEMSTRDSYIFNFKSGTFVVGHPPDDGSNLVLSVKDEASS